MFGCLFRSGKTFGIAVIVGLIGAACAAAATPTPAPTPTPQLPDTTGVAVWSYLQGVNYQENWQLWPGKGELYQGVEPHGMLLTTYLNSDALNALTAKAGAMPSGAIIVKENFMPDGTLDATTVMYKVPGFNESTMTGSLPRSKRTTRWKLKAGWRGARLATASRRTTIISTRVH